MKVLRKRKPKRLEDKPSARCRKWQLIVVVEVDGGPRDKTRTFRGTFTQACDATDGFAGELGGTEITSDTPVPEYVDSWIDMRRRQKLVANGTIRTDEDKLACVKLNWKNRAIGSITADDVNGLFVDAMEGKTPSGRPWAARTVIRMDTSMRAMFSYAEGEGHVSPNPMDGATPPRAGYKTKGKAMPESMMDSLLEQLDYSKRMHRAVALAVGAGFRESEAAFIEWPDVIDYEARITGACERDGSDKEPKNCCMRVVPLDDSIYEPLDANRGEGRVVGVLPHSISTWWKKHAKDFGCEGYTFHDLRRSFVTRLARHDVNESTAMDISGIKSPDTMHGIYVQVSGEMKRSAIRKAFSGAR